MKNIPQENNLYSTSDLGIAVFLFTSGYKLTKTTLIGPKRLMFHFHSHKNPEDLITKYFNETGKAPAKKLFENYRALRAIAFSKTENI